MEIAIHTFKINKKYLNWLAEIKACVTFSDKETVPIVACIKEVMLKNDIPLTYNNIEKMKYMLVVFKNTDNENIHLGRTSEIFTSREERRYLPLVDDSYRSHLSIRKCVWDEYERNLTPTTAFKDTK